MNIYAVVLQLQPGWMISCNFLHGFFQKHSTRGSFCAEASKCAGLLGDVYVASDLSYISQQCSIGRFGCELFQVTQVLAPRTCMAACVTPQHCNFQPERRSWRHGSGLNAFHSVDGDPV